MGNSASPTNSSNHLTPITQTSQTSLSKRRLSFNKPQSIYTEILKDAEKIRSLDRKANYNPHRRVESIASNLPTQLQNQSNSVHIVNEFWLSSIQSLSETELDQVTMVCYCRLYLKCKNVRHLLQISHTIKVFNVFGYVIRNLVDPSNHLKLFQQLQSLGKMHRGYALNSETYELFLDAFNYAMEEKFESDYKIRTRFCFGQLYRVIVDIMTGDDFYSFTQRLTQSQSKPLSPMLRLKRLSSAFGTHAAIHGVDTSSSSNLNIEEEFDEEELQRLQSPKGKKKKSFNYSQIDRFLGSLGECLSDEIGSLYFRKYLEEQFCDENFLFHESVLKYKAAKSSQRIRLGQSIIASFVEIGSEMEVNLSYNTRKQVLTIVNLVRKMNANKEKYAQIYHSQQAQHKLSSIINEDDLRFLNHETNEKNTHYRMATTKKLPLELFEVTKCANSDIPDLIYSMGFTVQLFDKAYDEIFHLMRVNFWSNFRNAILEFVNDADFVQSQKEKLQRRKEEQRGMGGMIQVINSIQKSMIDQQSSAAHNAHTPQNSLKVMLARIPSVSADNNGHSHKIATKMFETYDRHKRRKSKDDFHISYQQKAHSTKPLHFGTISQQLSQLSDSESNKDESDTETESDDIMSEEAEMALKHKVFGNTGAPRLSFIPSLMPSIERSATSPVSKMHNHSGFDTPNGGASVTPNLKKQSVSPNMSGSVTKARERESARHVRPGMNGSYSPSELFNLVSETFPTRDYQNRVKKDKRKSIHTNQTNIGLSSSQKKRKSKSIKSYNKNLPLYVTHKKRKSKSLKRNGKQPSLAVITNLKSV